MDKATNPKRRQLIVGNWKMNGNLQSNEKLLEQIRAGWASNSSDEHSAEVVICPPHAYLQSTASILKNSTILVGGQNASEFQSGAYTGEVSAEMLEDLGCRYVIIGHNERRRMQRETNEQVAQKFIEAQRVKLIPILCVGEPSEMREQGRHLEYLDQQLEAVFSRTGCDAFKNAVIAYEPIWAVGTGKTATPEQAHKVHHFIRKKLGGVAEAVRILYGGSVKAHNAEQLFALKDIDGALLGGASLDAEEFLKICQAAN